MDFIQGLDPTKLVQIGTGFAFALTLFNAPSYNFALYLFGCYVQENPEASSTLQTFTGLLGASVVFDLIWLFSNEQHWIGRILLVGLFLVKLPTSLVFFSLLRQRGGQFSGLSAGNLGGATVWSMPGGFTSNGREGYQNVDEEPFIRSVRTGPAKPRPQPLSEPEAQAAPGAYQTV